MQARLQQQRERERLAGAQFATLGQVAPGQAFRELSALEAIGAQRQQQQQQALDIAQEEYEIARTFPERTLQDYQSIIRGYSAPIPASTVQRSQTSTPAPSFVQQAAGLGGLALGASKFMKDGGLVGLADGGTVKKYQTGTGTTTIGQQPINILDYEQLLQNQMATRQELDLARKAFLEKKKETLEKRVKDSELDRTDVAAALLQYAASDPSKPFVQQVSQPVQDLLTKGQEQQELQQAYELEKEGIDIEEKTARLEGEQASFENALAILSAKSKGVLTTPQLASLTSSIEKIQNIDNLIALRERVTDRAALAFIDSRIKDLGGNKPKPDPRGDVGKNLPPMKEE